MEPLIRNVGKGKITLIQGDITTQIVETIVNAANSSLLGGGGVDGAIHRHGGPRILEDCQKIVDEEGPLPPGEAVITCAGDLHAKYVIHTVGPIWRGGITGEASKLHSAYASSLKLAEIYGVKSIAFPSISTGAYKYPEPDAASTAIIATADFLHRTANSLTDIRFVLYLDSTYDAFEAALRNVIR